MKILLLLAVFISPGELKDHVNEFTIKSRITGSDSLYEAQEYVIEECENYGLKVCDQGMTIRGVKCRNIIAWREGRNKDKIVVIGAHLDSVRITPGADDNASGSACLLLLAKRFAERRTPKFTIVFQWYTGEEQGLLGSKFYTKNPLFPRDNPDIKKHIFMLNFDMVGRLKIYPSTDGVDGILGKLFKEYPFAKSITFRTNNGPSDQTSFSRSGVPIVWLFTGVHRDYHKSTDTPSKLNYKGMDMICDYAFDIIIMIMDDKIPDYILWELPIYGEVK